MANKSPEERLAELDKKLNQIKAQKRALQNRAKTEERKKRTRHLIELGGVVEKHCGSITDLKAFEKYISQYANAIKSTQKGSVSSGNPEQ